MNKHKKNGQHIYFLTVCNIKCRDVDFHSRATKIDSISISNVKTLRCRVMMEYRETKP